MGQKFRASKPHEFANGAIGWAPGGPADYLGPFAKVENCPIKGTDIKRTCYATGYADTMFSIPACTRIKRTHIGGFFTVNDGEITFNPYARFVSKLKSLTA